MSSVFPYDSQNDRTLADLADLSDVDPAFVFDFRAYDDPGDGQRMSTWLAVEPLCRGPEPRPARVVTSQANINTKPGSPKTRKEAEILPV